MRKWITCDIEELYDFVWPFSEDTWADKYAMYLHSSEWRSLRRRVMARSRGICESCKKAPVAEVHHLTYRHAMKESLAQLKAVCTTCHRQLHGMRS
jgi:5-methylcytosine-specific restriction endonuclease McrA